ncbi:uncharacterized protein LOC115034241 isoform X2 [Acyrthosiphon pisum]|nr:uncharacterized protein LOC115034241 isoform X2 [Acyrthosiphon pisum]
MMQLYDYNYPVEDLQLVLDLLKTWKLEFLYQTLVDEFIDIEALQILQKDHINELMSKFPIGIKAKFTHKLQEWQKYNSIVNLPVNNLSSISVQHTTPPNLPVNNMSSTSVQHTTPSVKMCLQEVLNSTTTGKMILDYYKNNKKLNNNIRTLLVDAIISYIITKQIPMSVNLASSIGSDIVNIFQTEVKDTYFMKDGLNKNPKGKLYSKYYNSMRTLKISGLVPSKEPSVCKTISHSRHDIEFEPEDDINYILDKIMYDDSCSFPELENLWKQTTKHRLCEIQKTSSTAEILQKWKSYTLPLGYRLIDIDFKTLYPDCPDLKCVLEMKFQKVIKLLNEQTKDVASKKLLQNLNDNITTISENEKHAVMFYLLHTIFVPTSKKITRDDNGKKNLVKYSIKDSQDSFMIFKSSIAEIEEYITKRCNENTPIQPFILICGTPSKPKEIIVFFDCIKFKLFSISSAIDVCFKIVHIFNLEYPPQSSIVWLFIQKYFYVLNTKYDKACHTLGQILSDLNNAE